MSILSIFKGEKIKPLWRFTTRKQDAIIWKLLISPEGILASMDSVQIITLVRSNPEIRAAKNQVNDRRRPRGLAGAWAAAGYVSAAHAAASYKVC